MNENYVVSISGTQIVNNTANEVQILVPCTYKKNSFSMHLAYSEFDRDNGDLEIKSTLEIDKDGLVTLIREGIQKSKLTLEKGKRHICSYNTEFGPIMIGAFAKEITCDLEDDGGFIELVYSLDVNAELLSTNLVVIRIKKGETESVINSK